MVRDEIHDTVADAFDLLGRPLPFVPFTVGPQRPDDAGACLEEGLPARVERVYVITFDVDRAHDDGGPIVEDHRHDDL